MKKHVFVMIFWLIIISGFVLTQEFTLLTGKELLLKTIPVDPRDLLRGDYVILNYEIAQIQDKDFAYNSTVYVTLDTDDNNVGHVKEISYRKPFDGVYLKGKVGGCNTIIPMFKNGKCVNFGIESYFVKEGTGRDIEKKLQDGGFVIVVIDKNGNAKVKGFTKQ